MTTEDIQHEIERTRGEMAGTLQAIERKLSPRQLLDQAVDTMRDLASDQSRVGIMMRDNPLPLAVIGLGIGWLAMSGTRARRAEASPYDAATPSASAEWSAETDYAPAAAMGAQAGYGADSGYGEDLASVRERARRVAEQARQGWQRASSVTGQRVSEWSRTAGEAASDAADRTWEAYQDHPLTMGAVALVLGAAIGAMLPPTRIEARVVGNAAADVVRKAQVAGNDLMEKAGQAAKSAIRAAKRQGMDAAEQAADAANQAATMH